MDGANRPENSSLPPSASQGLYSDSNTFIKCVSTSILYNYVHITANRDIEDPQNGLFSRRRFYVKGYTRLSPSLLASP